ncbi:vam6/Vps39-like protein [Scaptodrosophila lebanonensis]|uniref:Vam6/Vps39-like protein n=1 Tax=Drosophila lebanonensis TaxID=7225 RepID=A0A6J2TEW8_DROLE|nr:vam6/Vps39-like protein [Scaptodrosophila lebanonensis]
MHQAYTFESVLKNNQDPIESISAYGDHVIVGTRGGKLILYSVDKDLKVDMRMYSNISKKPIKQMEMIAVENLLFVLTDGMIHVCDISRIEGNFALMHKAEDTKGCTLFSIDVKMPKSPTGEMVVYVIRICCAKKRTLELFVWDCKSKSIKSFNFSIELSGVPKALCWVDDMVCVGLKNKYIVYDMTSPLPEKKDTFLTSSKFSMEPCICLIRNRMLGISKDDFLVAVEPNDYTKPKDGDSQSRPSPQPNPLKPLQWSSPLLGLLWDDPYAVGRTNSTIEVRNLGGKDTLIQRIPELQKTKFLAHSESGKIFAASTSELWCLRMVDITTQRTQLLQQKKYQLAIELTQVSEEHSEVKAQTIREIRMIYAKELFMNKEFKAAMKEFEMAAIDPYDVIRLFPTLVPETKSVADAVAASNIPQLIDRDLENAYLALIDFLAVARQKEVVKLRDNKSSSKSLLEIIDTTLLKCYLQTNDTLVAPLLRLNQIHFEEAEKTLKKHGKIAELIILYQVKGKHKLALQLLKSQAAVEGSVLQGRNRTIRYLQELGADHLPLIFEFADWVLEEDPEEGLTIFTEQLIEVEQLPRTKVLDFLISKHKVLVTPYLEYIIKQWNDTNTLRHNVLIKQYRDQVQRLMEQNSKGEATPDLQPMRAKLCKFLEESNSYSPDRALEDFPTTMLLEERALILKRLKRHEKVLAIYIQVFGDIAKAKAYCEENYEDDKEIFHTLLKTILCPTTMPPYEGVKLHPDFLRPNRDVALEILNSYALKINPITIFPFLPDDMPMQQLQYYMEKVLRQKIVEQHERHIKRGLLEAELARLKAAVQKEMEKSFEITESTLCVVCKKRFNIQGVFVRYPNGHLVHLSCNDRTVKAAAPQ